MPHIVLTHSSTIQDKKINYEALFKELSITLASDDFCDITAIKCYHHTPQHVYLPTNNGFVHVELKLLERKTIDIQQKATKLRTIIKKAFPKSYAYDPSIFSFEVLIMNKDLYMKGSSF